MNQLFFLWAWFTANQSITAQGILGDTASVSGSQATVGGVTLKAKFEISDVSDVKLTTSDGASYGVSNGYLKADSSNAGFVSSGTDIANRYKAVTLTFKGWYQEDGSTSATAAQYSQVKTTDTVQFKVQGGSRLRVSTTVPTYSTFASVFGSTLGNKTDTITWTPVAGSNAQTTDGFDKTVYVAIYGGAKNDSPLKTKSDMDALIDTNSGFNVDSNNEITPADVTLTIVANS